MLVTYYNIGAATATLRTKVAKKWQTMAAATNKSMGDSQKVPVRPVAVGQGGNGDGQQWAGEHGVWADGPCHDRATGW